MNDILATEPNRPISVSLSQPLPLESVETNPKMRHIPSLDWMIQKLERTLHERLEMMFGVIQSHETAETQRAEIQACLRSTGRAFEKVCETIRPARPHHADSHDPIGYVRSTHVAAVAALRSLDVTTFGRREPFHHFDRSNSESIYGAVLSTIVHTDRLVDLVRKLDPSVDERLYAHLVNLTHPINDEVKKPIA